MDKQQFMFNKCILNRKVHLNKVLPTRPRSVLTIFHMFLPTQPMNLIRGTLAAKYFEFNLGTSPHYTALHCTALHRHGICHKLYTVTFCWKFFYPKIQRTIQHILLLFYPNFLLYTPLYPCFPILASFDQEIRPKRPNN